MSMVSIISQESLHLCEVLIFLPFCHLDKKEAGPNLGMGYGGTDPMMVNFMSQLD